jgi:uncharacterized protein
MNSVVALRSLLFSLVALPFASTATAAGETSKPLRVLLVTGGCCHDYATQTKALTENAAKLGAIDWTIVNEGGTGTTAQIPLYANPDWAKPYDVVVHNACFADTTDTDYIRKITAAHKGGKPAVVIHCAMHTYRAAKIDDWREFLGVTSRHHDHLTENVVRPIAKDHPTLRGFPETWTTPSDELYVIEKFWPTARSLAVSTSKRDGTEHPVIWTNDYHGARVFGTTFGHGNATWHDPVFTTLLARGIFWAAGRDL